jgi:thiosulfate/3-mercaptopyruvate sulfurtransferase
MNFLLAVLLAVASPRASIVVDPAWLAQHINDADLVLLHVGDKAEYEAGHIPGARYVSLDDISVSDHSEKGLMLEMPSADDLRQRLEKLGISDNSRVVVYFGKDRISPTTRVVFTLDYAGLGARTSLLDGGQPAWVSKGGALTKAVPPARTGRLSPLKIQPIVVDAAYVKSHVAAKGFAVVDARDSVYYDGTETGEHMGEKMRTGHVHGAISVPFLDAYDGVALKSPGALEALFAKAGVKPHDAVIGYCHIGMQATAMLFAAQSLGHPVLLYDGSFQDWSRHSEYAVDNPSAKK